MVAGDVKLAVFSRPLRSFVGGDMLVPRSATRGPPALEDDRLRLDVNHALEHTFRS